MEDQIQEMYGEITEYENLRDGKVRITIDRLSELPIALIKARISAGMTQGELADTIGIKEQQIQRYEANHYQAVGFDRLLEIAKILSIELVDEVVLQPSR
ncbi:helix-turn-helix transcriptional regulator [Chamaesiphon sp.]|uniref:helix-turn-helix transcriptional regulator n=1 Tax=Chamaesiphon sp. TaxID=2814140 RepID=UPI003593EE91